MDRPGVAAGTTAGVSRQTRRRRRLRLDNDRFDDTERKYQQRYRRGFHGSSFGWLSRPTYTRVKRLDAPASMPISARLEDGTFTAARRFRYAASLRRANPLTQRAVLCTITGKQAARVRVTTASPYNERRSADAPPPGVPAASACSPRFLSRLLSWPEAPSFFSRHQVLEKGACFRRRIAANIVCFVS